MRVFVSLCVWLVLFPVVAYADPPPVPTPDPVELARVIGVVSNTFVTLDLARKTETQEDFRILWIPHTSDQTVVFLYDTQTTAGVLVENLDALGKRFTVVPPGQNTTVEFSQDGNGNFGPQESLAALNFQASALTEGQNQVCSQACFVDHEMGACSECVGIVALWQFRPKTPLQDSPTPEQTPQEEQTPSAPPTLVYEHLPEELTQTPAPEQQEPSVTPTIEVPTP